MLKKNGLNVVGESVRNLTTPDAAIFGNQFTIFRIIRMDGFQNFMEKLISFKGPRGIFANVAI